MVAGRSFCPHYFDFATLTVLLWLLLVLFIFVVLQCRRDAVGSCALLGNEQARPARLYLHRPCTIPSCVIVLAMLIW